MLEKIDLKKVSGIALQAGREIMRIHRHAVEVTWKNDGSPLTEADRCAHTVICDGLETTFPEIPILSEESRSVPYEERKEWKTYWCIDPIDGTKEFIRKNGEFTVNIALIQECAPVLGVVFAPALRKMYMAKKGEGAYVCTLDDSGNQTHEKQLPLFPQSNTTDQLKVVASKSHMSEATQRFIDALSGTARNLELVSKGSSLKICMVAEGTADIYPRIAPTMEWDTAAAQAVAMESGKNIYIYEESVLPNAYLQTDKTALQPLIYNKPDLHNPSFVAV